MTKLEIITSLNELVAKGTRKSTIEGAVGIPVNSLASVLTGKKEMPNKWVEKFGGYFERLEVKSSGGDVQTAVNTLLGTGLIEPKDSPSTASFGEGVFVPSRNMEWIGKVEEWCKAKGFPPSELIEKYEGLENQLGEMIAYSSHITTSKLLTADEIKEKYGGEAYMQSLKLLNDSPNKPPT